MYEEYQRELERFLESDPEMFSLEAEIHHYIDILEPVLRDAGQEMWQVLDRIILQIPAVGFRFRVSIQFLGW